MLARGNLNYDFMFMIRILKLIIASFYEGMKISFHFLIIIGIKTYYLRIEGE